MSCVIKNHTKDETNQYSYTSLMNNMYLNIMMFYSFVLETFSDKNVENDHDENAHQDQGKILFNHISVYGYNLL